MWCESVAMVWPDGRQPLGLDHGRVVAGVLDGQGRLVADGDHQLQVVLGELVGPALLDQLLGRGRGVDVDGARPRRSGPAWARRSPRGRPSARCCRRAPAVVLPGVAGQHAFVPLDHVVEDRLADRDPLVGADALARAADLRLQRFGGRVQQHDAAAVGLDPLEDQFHDPVQQLVDVQRVADGQGRAVHDLQVAAGPGQPRVLRQASPVEVEDAAALLLRDASGRSASRRRGRPAGRC